MIKMAKIDPHKRALMNRYKILIGKDKYTVNAQSLGHALREASNLRIDDEDIITVRIKNG